MSDISNSPSPAVSPVQKEIFTLDFTVARALAQQPIGSPCTNVCRLDDSTRTYCIGCHRTRAEIKAWKTMNDIDKENIIKRLIEIQKIREQSIDKKHIEES